MTRDQSLLRDFLLAALPHMRGGDPALVSVIQRTIQALPAAVVERIADDMNRSVEEGRVARIYDVLNVVNHIAYQYRTRQPTDADLFAEACEAAWGGDWRGPAREHLKINDRTLRRFLSGDSPIPEGIWRDLRETLISCLHVANRSRAISSALIPLELPQTRT